MMFDTIISELEETAGEFYQMARYAGKDGQFKKMAENYNKARGVDVALSVLRHHAALNQVLRIPLEELAVTQEGGLIHVGD